MPNSRELRSSPSYVQESLWLAQRMSRSGAPVYNETLAFGVTGGLRVEALRGAMAAVLRRHEGWRTSFQETADGLRVVVAAAAADVVRELDLRDGDPQEAAATARRAVDAAHREPFDLTRAPLARLLVVRLPGRESVLALTVHHLVTDAWSMQLVLDELRDHYQALCASGQPAELPEPTARYADYVRAERAEDVSARVERWRELVAGAPELVNLPTDRPRPPVQSFRGATRVATMPRERLRALVERCHRECGTREFGVLLAAYAVLLHRSTGQDTVTVGTTVLHRPGPRYLGTVGCFVNTVPVVLRCGPDSTFREVLEQAADLTGRLQRQEDVPFPLLLDALGVEPRPSHAPVFQTMLTWLGRRPALDLGPGLDCRPYPVDRAAAKFDLLLFAEERGADVLLEAEYATDLFDPDTVDRVLARLVTLLDGVGDRLDVPVGRLPLLPAAERRQLAEMSTGPRVDRPAVTVPDLVEAQAARTPDAVAVRHGDRCWTYRELNGMANAVAHRLCGHRGFVGVYLDRSAEMVAALLGVVKAGLAYVPIDPDYPADRVRYMVEDSAVPVVLTSAERAPELAGIAAEPVLVAGLGSRPENPARSVAADDPVYMIYTSGSTGRPKGVVNRHGALLNRLVWMQDEYGLAADDRVLQKTPFSFDVSVWEFFWPLLVGAGIVVADPGGHRDPGYLTRLIRDTGVTTLHFVPSMLGVFLEEDDLAAHCRSLRRVFCSGEALPHPTAAAFLSTVDCPLHNLYGPTEAAIDVSHWTCRADYPDGVVPIGRPIANTSLYVLNGHDQPQPVGVAGELCIGGAGLAEGYHDRPELTRAAFVPDPFRPGERMYRTGDLARWRPDGQLEYLGRLDGQVKLRGFRIELGEIETAILELPSVREAAVVLHETPGHRTLVAYVVAAELDVAAAKEALGRRLPEFMVPPLWLSIAAVPLTANGKLDRRALPDPFAAEPAGDRPASPPDTAQERLLAGIWAEVLGVEVVDVDANFFQLGGDSILGITVAARLRAAGHQVEVEDLLAHRTVRELAARLGRPTVPTVAVRPFALLDPDDVALLAPDAQDAWPLTRLQAGMIFHSLDQPDSPVYRDVFQYELAGPVNPLLLEVVLHAVAATRPQLRSAFDLATLSRPVQVVRVGAEIGVRIEDLRGLDRAEQDAAVARAVEEEKDRGFDLESGPLFRATVQSRSESAVVLTLAFHHAILDGWSVALLVEQVRQLLAGRAAVPETLPYGRYVALEEAAARDEAQAGFWDRVAAGMPAVEPAGRPGPTVSAERELPEPVAARLRGLGTAFGVPPSSIYLALHLRALAGAGTGLVVNGRPEEPGAAEAAGLFLNTVPLAAVGDGGGDWTTTVPAVFAREQEIAGRRRFPLAEMLRRSGRRELFDVVFNYTDFHVYRTGADLPVRVVQARYFERTSFPVVVHVHRDNFTDRTRLLVNYDAARRDPAWVEAYLDRMVALAAHAPAPDAVAAGPLPVPVPAAVRGADRRPGPRGGVERQLAEIVAQAVGLSAVGPDEDYLQLGLDSISAIRVIARARRAGITLSTEDVLGHPTVRQLADLARRAEEPVEPAATAPFALAGVPRPALPAGLQDAYPATAMQLDMLRAAAAEPERAVYHDVFAYDLALRLDEPRLRATLDRLVERHAVLRTSFALEGVPMPLQLVHRSARIPLTVSTGGSVRDAFEAERRRSVDPTRPPLLRVHAIARGPAACTLVLGFQHAILDGWSVSLLVRELVEDYLGEPPPAPAPPYRDYVVLERDDRGSRAARSFWRDELAGAPRTRPAVGNGTAAGSGPGAGTPWSETVVDLGRAPVELAARLGVPVRQLLLACHLAVLGALGGDPGGGDPGGGDPGGGDPGRGNPGRGAAEVVTGVFTGGRPERDGADRTLGMFLNVLPFRQRVAGRTWAELLAGTAATDRRLLRHRRYPIADIQRDLGRGRILDTAFNFTRFAAYGELSRRGLVTGVRWFEHTAFDLLANAGHDLAQDRLVVTLNARADVLPQPALDRVGRLWRAALGRLADDPGAPVRIRE